jgi:hypothetical protein
MRIGHGQVEMRGVLRIVASASITALLLPACTKQTPPEEVTATQGAADPLADELNWAREALKRNPAIEVVATDTAAGVFTVRVKDTGEVQTVKLSELAAVPVSTLSATHTPTSMPEAAAPTPAPAASPEVSDRMASDRTADAQPTASTAASTSNDGSASSAPAAQSNPNYTIERADGQVKVSGPGISIVSTGTTTVSAAESAAGQRAAEPIICEGRRMLHFDNRNIYVDGDAIIARGGCELYITNSRVVASGTAVIIQDATVHIANSTVEGAAASFDARENAKVYVRSSTFEGLPRRAEQAVVQDQGGNQWR